MLTYIRATKFSEPGQNRKIAALTWIKCLCASFFFIKKGSVVLNERRYILHENSV